jgi:hypothetical protein
MAPQPATRQREAAEKLKLQHTAGAWFQELAYLGNGVGWSFISTSCTGVSSQVRMLQTEAQLIHSSFLCFGLCNSTQYLGLRRMG